MITKLTTKAESPLYISQFIDNNRCVLGGGGGVGKHGVKNQLIVLVISAHKATQSETYLFPDGSDCPTCISFNEGLVVGCNVPTTDDELNRVHLFTINDENKITKTLSLPMVDNNDISVYQKSVTKFGSSVGITLSDSDLLITAECGEAATKKEETEKDSTNEKSEEIEKNVESEKNVVEKDEKELRKKSLEKTKVTKIGSEDKKDEIVVTDLVFLGSESSFAYLTPDKLTIQQKSGKTDIAPPSKEKWARLISTSDAQSLFVSSSDALNKTSSTVSHVALAATPPKVVKTVKLPTRQVTALTCCPGYIAASDAAGTIYILEANELKLLCKFDKVHSLPITSLSFSPDGKSLVSASLDGSVVVHTNLEFKRDPSSKFVISALVILIFAMIALHLQKKWKIAEQLDQLLISRRQLGNDPGSPRVD